MGFVKLLSHKVNEIGWGKFRYEYSPWQDRYEAVLLVVFWDSRIWLIIALLLKKKLFRDYGMVGNHIRNASCTCTSLSVPFIQCCFRHIPIITDLLYDAVGTFCFLPYCCLPCGSLCNLTIVPCYLNWNDLNKVSFISPSTLTITTSVIWKRYEDIQYIA